MDATLGSYLLACSNGSPPSIHTELAKALIEGPLNGLKVWQTLLSSGDRDLIHRAAVTIRKFVFLRCIVIFPPRISFSLIRLLLIINIGNLGRFDGVREALVHDVELLTALKEIAAGSGLPEDLRMLLQTVKSELVATK